MEDLNTSVSFQLEGQGGGEWTLNFRQGKLKEILPFRAEHTDFSFKLHIDTFQQIVSGKLNPQQAFFRGDIRLEGDTFKALKMANILTQFFSAYPYDPDRREVEQPCQPEPRHQQPLTEERVQYGLEDQGGKIEGILAYRDESTSGTGIVVVPPHPLLGGNMDNNVVVAVSRHLATKGYITLRFNYRGVGRPMAVPTLSEELETFWRESVVPDEEKKVEEVFLSIDFLRSQIGGIQNIIIIGYSFGAYLAALCAARNPSIKALVMIAPPVQFHDFKFLKTAALPVCMVGSSSDFAYPVEGLKEFFNSLEGPKRLILIPNKDHFFLKQEERVASEIYGFLEEIQSP